MNIYKKSFEQKDKSAKHRKYSLTKTVTVAGDDIDLRQNKLRSLHISKSTKYKYKYRRSALYLKRVNKKSRIRNRYTTVYEEGPGGKGDGGNPPIISTDIKE